MATNLDNLLIGVLIGLRGKHISAASNACIALGSAMVSLLFCFLASFCTEFGRWPNYIGGMLLILLGLWPFIKKTMQIFAAEYPDESDGKAQSGEAVPEADSGENQPSNTAQTAGMGLQESLVLAAALSINCTVASFAAGMTGINPFLAAVMIGAFSFLAVGVGSHLGSSAGRRMTGVPLEAISSVMMILIGIAELCG